MSLLCRRTRRRRDAIITQSCRHGKSATYLKYLTWSLDLHHWPEEMIKVSLQLKPLQRPTTGQNLAQPRARPAEANIPPQWTSIAAQTPGKPMHHYHPALSQLHTPMKHQCTKGQHTTGQHMKTRVNSSPPFAKPAANPLSVMYHKHHQLLQIVYLDHPSAQHRHLHQFVLKPKLSLGRCPVVRLGTGQSLTSKASRRDVSIDQIVMRRSKTKQVLGRGSRVPSEISSRKTLWMTASSNASQIAIGRKTTKPRSVFNCQRLKTSHDRLKSTKKRQHRVLSPRFYPSLSRHVSQSPAEGLSYRLGSSTFATPSWISTPPCPANHNDTARPYHQHVLDTSTSAKLCITHCIRRMHHV